MVAVCGSTKVLVLECVSCRFMERRRPVIVRLAEIRCGQWVSYVTAIMDVDHGSVAHREPNKPEQSIYNLIDLDYEKVQVRESKYRPNTPTLSPSVGSR